MKALHIISVSLMFLHLYATGVGAEETFAEWFANVGFPLTVKSDVSDSVTHYSIGYVASMCQKITGLNGTAADVLNGHPDMLVDSVLLDEESRRLFRISVGTDVGTVPTTKGFYMATCLDKNAWMELDLIDHEVYKIMRGVNSTL